VERAPASNPNPASATAGIAYWLRQRSPTYIARRFRRIVSRYGISPEKAVARTRRLVETLDNYGCSPTFATPGSVVASYPQFMRELSAGGVELAVHGFDHVDFRGLTQQESKSQLIRAAKAFAEAGIPHRGFRCPYLSFSHDQMGFVPDDVFGYSSNEAVWWNLATISDPATAPRVIFDHLSEFYRPTPADDSLVLPRFVGDLVEIPVSLPDDLQLLDGLGRGEDGVGDAWLELLRASHERGSIFTVLMHPEAFDLCADAYERLLAEARSLSPAVWIARLCDVSDWWRELRASSAHIDGASIVVACPPRAFLLGRGLDAGKSGSWAGGYSMLDDRVISFDKQVPLVGAGAGVPSAHIQRLRQLGYLVAEGADAERCAVQIDAGEAQRELEERDLVARIESQPGPLVRLWQWPDGARSALCITGDLDALSLRDYARRVVTL
jgi:peptidoglycan/xylan/chitin deacetylase (PgdA/CDA1 family)